MDSEWLADLLERVRRNQVSVAEAMAHLRDLPFEDLGFAKVDHHRVLRQGFPEVVMEIMVPLLFGAVLEEL